MRAAQNQRLDSSGEMQHFREDLPLCEGFRLTNHLQRGFQSTAGTVPPTAVGAVAVGHPSVYTR